MCRRLHLQTQVPLLYEMLCGARAFPETSLEAMAEAKDKERYVSAKARGVEIPEFVDFILARCLRVNPDARYRTYASLQDAAETALSELTSCSAGSIVEKWIKAPERYVAPKLAKKRVVLVKPVVMGVTAAVIIVGLIVGAFIVTRDRKSEQRAITLPTATRPIASSAENAQPELPPPPDTSRPETETVTTERPEARQPDGATGTNATRSGTATPRDQAPAVIQSQRKLTAPEEALQRALVAFNTGNYTGAIGALESIGSAELRGTSADSAFLLLLGSYYMQSGTNPAYLKKAIDMAGSETNMRDGYFFLCKALIAQALGKNNEARESYERAVGARSIMGEKVRRESLYQRAVFYRKVNEKTQSAENTARMIDAWRSFADEECVPTSPECEEARRILRLHGE